MTYPPPPGQPGADGWQGGNDPNQMPPNDPYNQGMPGYPPQQDPYGQPPTSGAPDPYGQHYDLYGQPPASGVPDPYGQPQAANPYGQPPASGIPGTNPYSAPPSFGAPPPQPPPDSNNNTAWIVGGVVGVVVILLAVVSVLFVTGTFDSEPSDTAGTDESQEPKDPTNDPSGDKTDKPANSGDYVAIPKLCESLDMTELEETYNMVSESQPTQQTSSSGDAEMSSCSGYLGSLGEDKFIYFEFTAFTHPDKSRAESMQSDNESNAGKCDSSDKLDGPWEHGTVASAQDSEKCYIGIDEENTAAYVQDRNLAMELKIGMNKEYLDGKEADLLGGIAEQVLEAASA